MNPSLSPSLPQELWLYIHRIATAETSPIVAAYTDRYQYVAEPNPLIDMQDFLRDVSSFALVSRLWNNLTSEILYENIRVDGRFEALYAALERPGTARLVRSVRLSPTRFDHNIAILALCTRLEIVVLPDAPSKSRTELLVGAPGLELSPTAIPNLDSLKHVYWTYSDMAADLLRRLIPLAPHLEYLLVKASATLRADDTSNFPALPPLQRLTLSIQHDLATSILPQVDVKNLTRLHCNPVLFILPQLPTFHSLQTLEFFGSRGAIPFDRVFACCPRLQELRYDAWTAPFPSNGGHKPPLTCIRLHSAVALREWTNMDPIQAHFELLLSPGFPRLQRVVLHNNWYQVVKTPWFATFRDGLRDQGCKLEFPEGNVL
ncbi:hypothetical protein C8R46DRAFT_612610 [Mycena filopes]|nr:hypothetical protein C8R46DRAFT_612610 [Mycena filopes]